MRSKLFPTLCLIPCALLLAAGSCGERVISTPIYPPRADLAVEAKPRPGPEIVTSAQASALHDAKVESWGERGWATVARLCRWAARNGMAIDCPEVSVSEGGTE